MLTLCGSNDSFQQGEKSNNKNAFTENPVNCPPVNSRFDAYSISSFSVYGNHAILITKDNEAFASGSNAGGRITGSLPKCNLRKFTKFVIKDENGRTLYPISAACGDGFTLFLVSISSTMTDTRLAYSYDGIKTAHPLFLKTEGLQPVSLFCGSLNAAAICTDGSIIFVPETIHENSSPHLTGSRLPDGDEAVCVAFCNDFILAVGKSGKLFESKPPKTGNKLEFSLVESLKNEKILEVTGTNEHCLAVTEDGRVFARGSNNMGQLCIGEKTSYVGEFTELSFLRKHRIIHAYAGYGHSLFQTESGKVIACGTNGSGELLTNEVSSSYFYSPIDTPITSGATFCVAGFCITAVFTGHDPIKSPNRRIPIQKVPSSSTKGTDPLTAANAEISRLKDEVLRLQKEVDTLKKSAKKTDTEEVSKPKPPSKSQPCIDLLRQSTINSLKIVETIGRGAQSQVYKVSREEYYALKVLDVISSLKKSKNSQNMVDHLKRFLQEYEILHMLNHPNIIRAFGFSFGDDKHGPSILLEFCASSLSDAVEDMSDIERVCLIYEVSIAMAAVHEAGLIHRDLKPANILIDNQKHVRVSDFGVSCIASVESQTQSMTGGVGTLKFMAPELLNESKRYSNKVDVYSFGVVVFFVLTGGEMPKISFAEQVTGKQAKIPKEINKVSRELIGRCWSFKAEDRPSFSEIAELIRAKNFSLIEGVEKQIKQIKEFLSI